MNKIKYIAICCMFIFSCKAQEVPTEFSELALNEIFKTQKGKDVKFQDILDAHKGKQIVIDVWATWCKDCIKGMPKIKALQKEFPDAIYVFLSLDKTTENWKKGIKKYNIKGDHYYMQGGWNGHFGKFVDLDWIPRYMVIDENQKIKLFRAIKADDNTIKEALIN